MYQALKSYVAVRFTLSISPLKKLKNDVYKISVFKYNLSIMHGTTILRCDEFINFFVNSGGYVCSLYIGVLYTC